MKNLCSFCSFAALQLCSFVVLASSLACAQGDPDASGSAPVGTRPVTMEDVQRILAGQKLGHTHGFAGRIAILTSPFYREAIGHSSEQVAEVSQLVETIKLDPELIEKMLVEDISKISEREASKISRDSIADLKQQVLFAETKIEGILDAPQYKRMLAIQAYLTGLRALDDRVVARECQLNKSEIVKIRRAISTTTKEQQLRPVDTVAAMRWYFSVQDSVEQAIRSTLNADQQREFNRLRSEGKRLCEDIDVRSNRNLPRGASGSLETSSAHGEIKP